MHEIKTLGWTISEWQTAYLNNQIQLDTLKDLVAAIDPHDKAWISIALWFVPQEIMKWRKFIVI